jgi:hypothetical protein
LLALNYSGLIRNGHNFYEVLDEGLTLFFSMPVTSSLFINNKKRKFKVLSARLPKYKEKEVTRTTIIVHS